MVGRETLRAADVDLRVGRGELVHLRDLVLAQLPRLEEVREHRLAPRARHDLRVGQLELRRRQLDLDLLVVHEAAHRAALRAVRDDRQHVHEVREDRRRGLAAPRAAGEGQRGDVRRGPQAIDAGERVAVQPQEVGELGEAAVAHLHLAPVDLEVGLAVADAEGLAARLHEVGFEADQRRDDEAKAVGLRGRAGDHGDVAHRVGARGPRHADVVDLVPGVVLGGRVDGGLVDREDEAVPRGEVRVLVLVHLGHDGGQALRTHWHQRVEAAVCDLGGEGLGRSGVGAGAHAGRVATAVVRVGTGEVARPLEAVRGVRHVAVAVLPLGRAVDPLAGDRLAATQVVGVPVETHGCLGDAAEDRRVAGLAAGSTAARGEDEAVAAGVFGEAAVDRHGGWS